MIFITIGVVLCYIFIMCLFALIIKHTVVELKDSIKERNIFHIVFGTCAIGIELLGSLAFIWIGFDFIITLLDKIF